jgi:hypothetical protein
LLDSEDMSDKEIEDPAHYVKLDVKKIEAVNGLLQLVQQNQLKADRAEIIKQKYWTTKSSPQINHPLLQKHWRS